MLLPVVISIVKLCGIPHSKMFHFFGFFEEIAEILFFRLLYRTGKIEVSTQRGNFFIIELEQKPI